MIFSKHRRIDGRRRFGGRDFRSKVRAQQNYKRPNRPISLNRSSRWMRIAGLKSRLFRVLWISLAVAIIYAFVFSNYMVIDNISATGGNRVSNERLQDLVTDLSNQRAWFVPKTSFFFLTRGRLESFLTESEPLIKEITAFNRTWPNQLSFEIKERDPGFILQVEGNRYLIDDEGIVVNSNPPGDLDLPLVVDQVFENFDVGSTLPDPKMVAFILSMHNQWGGKINTPIIETRIPGKASGEAHFVTEEGWIVMFDTERAVVNQLNNLALLLNRQISTAQRADLAYIDLRLSKWAYYCFNNTPCVQDPTELEDGEEADGNIPVEE